eukprot:2570631-Amphidinium_carterae.1
MASLKQIFPNIRCSQTPATTDIGKAHCDVMLAFSPGGAIKSRKLLFKAFTSPCNQARQEQ